MHNKSKQFSHWLKRLRESDVPAYLLLPELIAEDIKMGRLSNKDRLPTLRDLSVELELNYTTIARGYAQARKMGLIDSKTGSGTFIKGSIQSAPIRGGSAAEMTMNLPPEPKNPLLLEDMKVSAAELMGKSNIYEILRYQDFGGSDKDKSLATQWLQRRVPSANASQVLVAPGIHSVLTALFSMLAKPGETICIESLTYPGVKAIAAQLGVVVHPIHLDKDGPSSHEFENACQTLKPKAFYCNPTLLNPTSQSITLTRRNELADIALKYSIPIIEDDAYSMLPTHFVPALATIAPELTYYVSGLSKCFGAGVRSAFVSSPSVRASQRLAGSLRATTVMASPITNALTSHWIENGVVDRMLIAIREESAVRQKLVTNYFKQGTYEANSQGFHLWLPLINEWSAVEFASYLRGKGVSVVASAAFSSIPDPPEAVRICLGGPTSREECEMSLKLIADTMNNPVHPHSTV